MAGYNRPFPSCLLPVLHNECKTIYVKFIFMQIKLIFIKTFNTKTHLQTETLGNSEMVYKALINLNATVNNHLFLCCNKSRYSSYSGRTSSFAEGTCIK